MSNMKVDLSVYENLEPDYNGSVQELYFSKEHPGYMVCKTTSGGSVFDVGTIFSIPNSDLSRTAVRHKIYSLLESKEEWAEIKRDLPAMFGGNAGFLSFIQEGVLERYAMGGADTHHAGMIDKETGIVYRNSFPDKPSPYVMVRRFDIIKPARLSYLSNNLWDYSSYYGADKNVVPLENIVRFGVTPGSSVYKKYMAKDELAKKAYLEELGLGEKLVPWTPFQNPTVDFTTKYEPEDRNLSVQEALYVSGCGSQLVDIAKMCLLGSVLVQRFFNRLGLFLWDLKWEIARDGDKLLFVDTIDTDSIRVTTKLDYKGNTCFVNINKQSMRDYYKIMHPEWVKAIGSAKQSALKAGNSFHEHLKAGQDEGNYPRTPEVDKEFISIQEDKFNTLISYFYGHLSAERAAEQFRSIAHNEVRYYDSNKVLDQYLKINS